MKLQDIIAARYSCRNYTDQLPSQEQLDYIQECVRLAPSAVNKQPWHFRVITTEEGKANLRACYKQEWFATAPCYIVASILHDEEWIRKDGKAHGNVDIAIAVEHLCLAATELGLATCWVCNFDANLAHVLLKLPRNEEAAVIIPLGYAAVAASDKKRKPMDQVWVADTDK